MKLSESFMGTAHLVRANESVHTFSGNIVWAHHGFYAGCLCKHYRGEGSRDELEKRKK